MKTVLKLSVLFVVFLAGCSGAADSDKKITAEEVVANQMIKEDECADRWGKGYQEVEDLKKQMDSQVSALESENKYLKLSNEQLLGMLGDDAWLKFESEELGLSFSYPVSFGALHFEIYNCPVAGKGYGGSFENVNYIFGGQFLDCEYEGGDGHDLTYAGGDQFLEWYGDDFVDYFEVDGGKFMYFEGRSGSCGMTDGYIDGDLVAATTINKNGTQGGLLFRSYERQDECYPDSRVLKTNVSKDVFDSILKTVKIY